jgi:preprotein translocase subunit SecG
VILAAVAAAAKGALKAAPIKVQSVTPQVVQAAPAAQQPVTWFQQHASWATHGIAGIFIVAAVGLVILLAVQTTKQEGLSGTIGGRVESAYSRMGAEEQLKRITGFAAAVFVITAFVLSITGI